MQVSLKHGVSIRGIRPETVFLIERIKEIYAAASEDELVITSVTDGIHGPNSLHYVGFAVDTRLPHGSVENIILELAKERLGREFDVVQEATHIHWEYQPEGRAV